MRLELRKGRDVAGRGAPGRGRAAGALVLAARKFRHDLLWRQILHARDYPPAAAAQTALFDAAQARLGRDAARLARWGRPEREVVAACTGTRRAGI